MNKSSHIASFFILFFSLNNLFAGTMGEVEPKSDFNGLYVGLGTGLMNIMSQTSFSNTYSQFNGYFDDYSHAKYNNTAILFSGQIGYGKMIRPKTYLGAKSSVYYTPFKFNSGRRAGRNPLVPTQNTLLFSHFTSETSIQPIYNIDLIFGYEAFSHLLPFIEGGVSFANVKQVFHSNRSFINESTSQDYNHQLNLDGYKTGYNVGIGLNYLAHKNWFFFGELVYSDLGKNAGSVTTAVPFSAGPITEIYARTEKNQAISLLAGISYLFNA